MNGYADADRRGLVEKGGFEGTDLATLAHLECPLCAKGIQYKTTKEHSINRAPFFVFSYRSA